MYNIIGLDLDNTLTEIDTTLEIISRELSVKKINVEEVFDYNLFLSFGISNSREQSFWLHNESEIIEKSILSVNRYNSILDNFGNKDTLFYIITSRHEMHKEKTTRWLKTNNIKYDKLIMTGGASKSKHIEKLGVELMVDDSPFVIEDIYKRKEIMNVDVVKIEYSYNKNHPSKYIMDLCGNLLTK